MINVAHYLYESLGRLVEITGNHECVSAIELCDSLFDQLVTDCGAAGLYDGGPFTLTVTGMPVRVLRRNPYPTFKMSSPALEDFTFSGYRGSVAVPLAELEVVRGNGPVIPMPTLSKSNDPVQGPPYAAPDPLPTKAPPPVEEKPRKKFREFL